MYLLHQTVIVIAAYYVVDLAAAEPLQWLTLLVVSVAGTFALYEVVRRTRVTRWAFGMKARAGPRGEEGAGGRRRPERRVMCGTRRSSAGAAGGEALPASPPAASSTRAGSPYLVPRYTGPTR